ncbi:MAG TPA: disulfide bond formation protein B [Azospirillaceae bacterium]|nr:disulfide bond formation protein B [Azospirillaceae bacterium]
MPYIGYMSPSDFLSSPRAASALLIGASLAALGTALLSQYVGGLPPCDLCIWQRWAYVAAILLLAPGFVLRPEGSTGRMGAVALALGGVAFLGVAGIAVFHVGVEQHWWQGLQSCSAGGTTAQTAEEMLAAIMAAPVVRCDEVPWSLFGISIAGFNALAALVLAGTALYAARAALKRF